MCVDEVQASWQISEIELAAVTGLVMRKVVLWNKRGVVIMGWQRG